MRHLEAAAVGDIVQGFSAAGGMGVIGRVADIHTGDGGVRYELVDARPSETGQRLCAWVAGGVSVLYRAKR